MKKIRDFTFVAGAVLLCCALLATIIPGITITDFTLGFLMGFSIMMIIVGLVLAVVPVFCKKKKTDGAVEPSAEPKE
jgi:Mg/Co/Ni transporter MgtE